jgi:phosphate transport system permease protein
MIKQTNQPLQTRPLFVTVLAILLAIAAIGSLVGGIYLASTNPEVIVVEETEADTPDSGEEESGFASLTDWQIIVAALAVAILFAVLAQGTWKLKNWARTTISLLLLISGAYYGISLIFAATSEIFAGKQIMSLVEIGKIILDVLVKLLTTGLIPIGALYGLKYYSPYFEETPEQRNFIDRSVRYILIAFALSAIIIVFLIIVFTMNESWEAVTEIGLDTMLLGTIWRPGSIIGTEDAQFGLVPMVVGSILSTLGAAVIGVPLSILTAILLSEVAPQAIREIFRPMIELLAGIPSVVYGLFGMVVLAPMIRFIEIPYNTGFGLLNASIILAVMIIPTVTNIAEDAIRAVPREYKEGSLALGTTRWQTIWNVILPAARSGIIAAIILGIGRALGETMALIMVIGNTIALPKPLTENPLTILLATARTLTGNIAVEINYAAGPHRSALFFTGILLFLMIFLVNSIARYLMRERLTT